MDISFKYRYYCPCPCGQVSECDLRIIRQPGKTIVIATERDDNPGSSITNIAEDLADDVRFRFCIPLCELLWIEHYHADNELNLPERWALVSFVFDEGELCCPDWVNLDRGEVEALAGVGLDAEVVQ